MTMSLTWTFRIEGTDRHLASTRLDAAMDYLASGHDEVVDPCISMNLMDNTVEVGVEVNASNADAAVSHGMRCVYDALHAAGCTTDTMAPGPVHLTHLQLVAV